MEKNYIPIIFGLKIKQIRNECGMTLAQLAKSAKISKSYLNEIEKGKKYPKTDKILALSEALDKPYDELVSLNLDKKLTPISDLLKSNILAEIPLSLFGIEERSIIDIIADAPDKITAFISTLIEMSNNYNFTKSSFYLAALRSFQEVNNNYFPWIEEQSNAFVETYLEGKEADQATLEEILITSFGYTIKYVDLKKENPELESLRSIFIPKNKTLLINTSTLQEQVLFILCKEIGYQYLKLKERLKTFTWAKVENFEQVLNNFYISYFAGAVLIPEKKLVPMLVDFFKFKKWNPQEFEAMIASFGQSVETFYQRLTNLLPTHLGLKSIFFIRMVHPKGTNKYVLNKELHLDEKQSPHAVEMKENYCQRWVSVRVMKSMEKEKLMQSTGSQISIYPQYKDKKYWVISTATQDPFKENYLRSVSIGFSVEGLRKKINFVKGAEVKEYQVDITCENCPISNCAERVVPPTRLEKKRKNDRIIDSVEKLTKKYKKI